MSSYGEVMPNSEGSMKQEHGGLWVGYSIGPTTTAAAPLTRVLVGVCVCLFLSSFSFTFYFYLLEFIVKYSSPTILIHFFSFQNIFNSVN